MRRYPAAAYVLTFAVNNKDKAFAASSVLRGGIGIATAT